MAECGRDAGQAPQCPICMENYEEPPSERAPMFLLCGHTFCRADMARFPQVPGAGGGAAISCPTCRTQTELPGGGAGALPHNYGVIELLARGGAPREAAAPRVCFACDDTATHHCPHCVDGEQYMCDACLRAHARRKATSGHDAQRLPDAPARETCPRHGGEPFRVWCETCQERICVHCLHFDHPRPGHDTDFFSPMFAREAAGMRAVLADVEGRLPRIEAAAARVQGVEAELAQRREGVRGEIRAQYAALRDALGRREQAHLARVAELAAEKAARLSAQRETLARWAERMRDGCGFARRTLDGGAAAPERALLARRQLLGDLRQMAAHDLALDPQQDARLLFHNDGTEELLRSIAAQGAVAGAGADPARCVPDGAGLREAFVGQEAVFTLTAVDFDGARRAEGGDRVAVELLLAGRRAAGAAADNGDGTYRCSYTPAADGNAELRVTINGGAVSGSPFAVNVTAGRQLQFTAPFDTNGVLYYIGTGGGTHPYRNPHTAGDVVAAVSSKGAGSVVPESFVAHVVAQGTHCYTQNTPDSWWSVDLGDGRALRPNHYCLRDCGACNGSHVVRNWQLEGSQDGAAWTVLRAHADDTSMAKAALATAAWPVPVPEGAGVYYRHFRILATGPNAHGNNHLMCSGIELYGMLRELK